MDKNFGKVQILIGITVVAVVVAVFFNFLSPSVMMKSKDITVENKIVSIPDPFGVDIKGYIIKEVKLIDSIPKLGQKINGAGVGNKHIGKYNVEGMGEGRVYIESDKGPFINILTADNSMPFVIINYEDDQKTRDLYNKIVSNILGCERGQ